eukprot:s436_g59.t1
MRPTFGGRHYTPSSGKSQVRPPPSPSRFDTNDTDTDLNTDELLDLNSNMFNSVPAGKTGGLGLMNSLGEEEETNADLLDSTRSSKDAPQGGKAAKKRVSTLPASARPPSRPSTTNSTRRPGRPGAVPGTDEQSPSARTSSRPSSVSKSRPERTVTVDSQLPLEESRGSAIVGESEGTGGRSSSHHKSGPKKRCSTLTAEPKDCPGAEDQAEGSSVARGKSLQRRASTIGTVPPPASEAGPPVEGFRRQLSFVDVTTDEIAEVMESEAPGQDWLQGFWFRVLSAPAAPECRSLGLRTLTNWVAIYNRWQSLGNWKPGQAPQVCDAVEMKDLLGIPMGRVMEFVKLFDPAGFARVTMTKSPQDYAKVKIPVPAFLTACILMSTAISKQNKIRFLLGRHTLDAVLQ